MSKKIELFTLRGDSTYQKIISILENKPSSQGEIQTELGSIALSSIKEHLDKAMNKKIIGFVGRAKHSKLTLQLKWGDYIRQYYVYTPESGKLYAKLIKKYKGSKQLIYEIVDLFRVIEVITKTQYVYFSKPNIIRRIFKSKGQKLINEEIKDKITLTKTDVNRFYRKRHKVIRFPIHNITEEKRVFVMEKLDKFLDVMPPLMHWVAYREIPPSSDPRYDISKSIPKQVTKPMLDKLGALFIKTKEDK